MAPDVRIDNVCVHDDGQGNINNPPAVEFDATGGTIENSTVSGGNATSKSVEIALGENGNTGYTLTANHDYLFNCGECVHNDGWVLKNSYVDVNATPYSGGYSGSTGVGSADHHEDVYCDTGSFTANHDTLLNQFDETAEVFCNTNNGSGGVCANHIVVTRSLLAGGGFVIYSCPHATAPGSSSLVFSDNNVARCGRRATYQPSTGGATCGRRNQASSGANGYWPRGGYFGVVASTYCPLTTAVTWSGNVWDDNGRNIRC
jgi:hypothetical protein